MYVKLLDLSSFSQAASAKPLRSLSVINGPLWSSLSNSSFNPWSHNDQSRSLANGEIPASHPGLYSPEQKYSIIVSSRKKLPCANPGGTQIHSPCSSLRRAGMS